MAPYAGSMPAFTSLLLCNLETGRQGRTFLKGGYTKLQS